MKPSTIILVLFIAFSSVWSCTKSPTIYATKWTSEIKQKIIVDASQQPSRSAFDSNEYRLTLYNGERKLKEFWLRPKFDTTSGKLILMDTLLSEFYSKDQNFKLVREFCQVSDRSFEGIDVGISSHGSCGLIEFRFCDGKIKERGFRYDNQNVGVWTKYDSSGNIIEQHDNGKTELLNKLKDIKYYR